VGYGGSSFSILSPENHMLSFKTVIVAQLLISCMMALSMIGIFTFHELGFTHAALNQWLSSFIVAWPIAFLLSMVISRIAFAISTRLTVRA
jgi:hypothetical protein